MGKKGRSKKNSQDKQRHDVDDDNPNFSFQYLSSVSLYLIRYSDISSLTDNVFPSFIHIWKHDQEKLYKHVNIPKR
ncbi:hypothetical protein ES288_A05G332400v1 [Gossypium darwinii]|uniref:Uncharacterized protein n=1 Tax=Gossypium darwinii TaxID=34276 RepID=A0A5D2GP48_GOSDA|nr:hypothetical protein ES288_A05G332400v1 [Gossypium darwinii]